MRSVRNQLLDITLDASENFSKILTAKKIAMSKAAQYKSVVYVKDTNDANGTGHVSASVIKVTPKGSKIKHISFIPSSQLDAMLTGFTFGSVPVKGVLIQDHKEDLAEADHYLEKPISKDNYKACKKVHEEITKKVEKGTCLYSLFGSSNPVCNVFSFFYAGTLGSRQAAIQHKKQFGFYPPEDLCGIEVLREEQAPNSVEIDSHNCITLSKELLQPTGVKVSACVPSNLTQELIENGYERHDGEKTLKNKQESSLSCGSRKLSQIYDLPRI